MWAYDAFATFGSIAMLVVGFGYATLCFCRDSCLNFVSTCHCASVSTNVEQLTQKFLYVTRFNSFFFVQQLGILVLYTCVAGWILWPLLQDYDRLERASRGEVGAIGESIGKSFINILNNASTR